MQRFGLVLVFILALMLCPAALEGNAAAAQAPPKSSLQEFPHKFPWITPFEEGRYIGELLPAAVSETDFQKLGHSLGGKELTLIILDAGGGAFESVSIGFYDEKKRDVSPLWTSLQRDELPATLKQVPFDDLFIKYNYLPGDKYVSSNFKVGIGASYGGQGANIRVFSVNEDMDFAGAALKAGDFILASDSGCGGALSGLSDDDYSDIVFVLRQSPEPLLPTATAFWILGGCGILGLTWWGFSKGKQGLDS